MLYIIGVAHRAQSRRLGEREQETEPQRVFAQTLRDAIETFRPTLVAEEDCEESLSQRGETSIAKEMIAGTNIEHRFCDANTKERQAIGYKDQGTCRRESCMDDAEGLSPAELIARGDAIFIGREFPKRERFWLERLRDCRDRVAIFICGEAHIKNCSLGTLLTSVGIPHKVVEHGIGLTEEDAWLDKALDHLGQHPELADG